MNLSVSDCNDRDQECSICTEKFVNPTKLPCGHVFCFLCVKGFPSCALCRAEITPDYMDDPVILKQTSDDIKEVMRDFQWYYYALHGLWKYDERSNIELEKAYNAGVPECLLRLGRFDYIVNFQTMMQMRQDDRTRRRKVLRSVPTLPAKGVAGIKKKEWQLKEIVSETEFNEADTIPLYTNNEAQPVETDHHEMFRDFFYGDTDD